MKPSITPFLLLFALSSSVFAQEEKTAPATETTNAAPQPDSEFDKKFRFGLRVTPQPTWINSGDKNNVPAGTSFGFGFGLNLETKMSPVVSFLSGVGGDFESGKYTVRHDTTSNYEVIYWMDQANEIIEPGKSTISDPGNKVYVLRERIVKTTHITIPLMLKLSTQEYSGMKYFGMFGAELGIRVNSTADDTYYEERKYTDAVTYKVVATGSTQTDINISGESAGFPVRVGFNAGLGGEYRIAGGTSLLVSVNYFRSFTRMLRKESETTYYDENAGSYKFVKQDLKLGAIRINIGIMF